MPGLEEPSSSCSIRRPQPDATVTVVAPRSFGSEPTGIAHVFGSPRRSDLVIKQGSEATAPDGGKADVERAESEAGGQRDGSADLRLRPHTVPTSKSVIRRDCGLWSGAPQTELGVAAGSCELNRRWARGGFSPALNSLEAQDVSANSSRAKRLGNDGLMAAGQLAIPRRHHCADQRYPKTSAVEVLRGRI